MRLEVRDLAQGVDACIRPARAVNSDFFSREFEERLFENTLDGSFIRLALPAAKIGAVVAEHQFIIKGGRFYFLPSFHLSGLCNFLAHQKTEPSPFRLLLND